MFERLIENYRYGKENLNEIRFKLRYIFLPIYLVVNVLLLLTCFILFLKVENPLVFVLILLALSLASSIVFIIYSRKVAKKEIDIETKKLEEFFAAKLLDNPDEEYVMPRANELGVVKLLFSESGINIDDINYSFDAFDCSLWTSNYLNKVNLIAVFYRNAKGDEQDKEKRGVTQFSMPLNLNMLSIMSKYKIELKNPDVLRFIKENNYLAASQILKYGKIQENYDEQEKESKLEKRQAKVR